MKCLSVLCALLLLRYGQTHEKFVRPEYIPYCVLRDTCRSICTCIVSDHCELLEMDKAIRDSIIFYHNQIRQIETYGEPQPAGMPMLEYDIQLEEISKCWALRCEDEYSSCFITPKFNETSQTTFQLLTEGKNTTSNFFWIEIMNFWLGTVKSMSVEMLDFMPGGEKGARIHNYAQLLSDKILYVGCSWSKTNQSVTFVCSYGPRGPVYGESIYKRGDPCTDCPSGYGCDYKKPFSNLCKKGVGITSTTPFITPPVPPPKAPEPLNIPPIPPPQPCTPDPTTTETPVTTPPTLPSYPPHGDPDFKPSKPSMFPPKNCAGNIPCVVRKPPEQKRKNHLLHSSSPLSEGLGPASPGKDIESGIAPDTQEKDFSKNVEFVALTERHHHGFTPLIPLRNIPHSSLLSSSIISQPIQPIEVGHRSRVFEESKSESSRIAPSLHFDDEKYDESLKLRQKMARKSLEVENLPDMQSHYEKHNQPLHALLHNEEILPNTQSMEIKEQSEYFQVPSSYQSIPIDPPPEPFLPEGTEEPPKKSPPFGRHGQLMIRASSIDRNGCARSHFFSDRYPMAVSRRYHRSVEEKKSKKGGIFSVPFIRNLLRYLRH